MNTEPRNPALVEIEGLLVFTGTIDQPDVNWLERVRAERDEDILKRSLDPAQSDGPSPES